MNRPLIIMGASSSIGSYLFNVAKSRGRDVFGVSSSQCNLLDLHSVQAWAEQAPKVPVEIVLCSVINKSVANSRESFEQNITLVENFLNGVARLHLARLVYLSSADVYGANPRLPITESTNLAPDTWYGHSKCVCEWLIGEAKLSTGRRPMIVRIPGIYGPIARDRSVIGSFVRAASEGRPILLNGDGRNLRDYLYIDDLCGILLSLLDAGHEGVVNAASGTAKSIREILDLVESVHGQKLRVEVSKSTDGRNFDLVFNVARLTELDPEGRRTSLEQGIRESFEALRKPHASAPNCAP